MFVVLQGNLDLPGGDAGKAEPGGRIPGLSLCCHQPGAADVGFAPQDHLRDGGWPSL